MPVLRWISRLLSATDRRRRRHARDAQRARREDLQAQLQLVRLEERRVLNADFGLVGDQLQLTNFADGSDQLIVQETADAYQFTLAEELGGDAGVWSGSGGAGISAAGNTLSVLKSAVGPGGVASILIDDSPAGSDLVVEFQTVDLSGLPDGLTALSIDAVTQAASTALLLPQLQLSANSINLPNPGNDFDRFQGTAAGPLSLADRDDLTLDGATSGGPLSVLAAGPITIAGKVQAFNSESVSLTAHSGDIAIRADVLSTAAASGNLGDGSGLVTLAALTGNITTDGAGTIRASGPGGRAQLTAGGDIGATTPLSTAVSQLAAVAGGTTGIQVSNSGDLLASVQADAGTVRLSVAGRLESLSPGSDWSANAFDIAATDDIRITRNVVADGAGGISIAAQGDLQLADAIRNSGGGDTVLTSGAALVVEAPIESSLHGSAGGGSIRLVAAEDVAIRADVTTTGGELRGAGADTGRILVDAGRRIDLQPGVLIATGTGRMTGSSLTTDTGEVLQTPPPIQVLLVPVDQGGSNVDALGHGLLEVTIDDPGIANYQIQVDWADGFVIPDKISTYRPERSDAGGNDFVSVKTYRFDHYYLGNPDVENPADPIPVKVTIRYDGRSLNGGTPLNGIVFREAGRELATSVTEELTVPGTGLFAFIKVEESEIVPVEFRQSAPAYYVAGEVAAAARQEELLESRPAVVEETSAMAMRLFFRRVDAAGQEGEDYELPTDGLERGLDEIFRKFPNGQYRVYLQEPNSRRIRLIREIHVYQGRIVPADFREDVMERQPGGGRDAAPEEPLREPPSQEQQQEQPSQPAEPPDTAEPGSVGAPQSAAALAAWAAQRPAAVQLDRVLEQVGRSATMARWRIRHAPWRTRT